MLSQQQQCSGSGLQCAGCVEQGSRAIGAFPVLTHTGALMLCNRSPHVTGTAVGSSSEGNAFLAVYTRCEPKEVMIMFLIIKMMDIISLLLVTFKH